LIIKNYISQIIKINFIEAFKMLETLGIIKNITHKYFSLLDEESRKKRNLNDSDDEMIIRNKNEIM
jgi:hypothetical protein